MEYSKAFHKLTFEEKAYLLHTWFPETTTAFLSKMQQYIKEWLSKTEFLKRNWVPVDISAEKWIELLQTLDNHISEFRPQMEQSPFEFIEPFTKGFFKTFFLTRLKEFLAKDCTDKLFKAIALSFFFPQDIQ